MKGREKPPRSGRESGHVACIDIGKTNKRVVVFDERLGLVAEESRTIPEIEGPSGIRIEDIAAIEDFVDGGLADAARRYPVTAIGISTHAGTWVGMDAEGRRSLPVIAYTNEIAEAESDELVRELGGEEELYLTTATPRLPAFVNMGLGVAFAARHFPDAYSRTTGILNLPQYLGYRLTGEQAVERTYLGCHSYLWNFAADTYSDFARAVGYEQRAPGRPLPTRDLRRPLLSDTARRLGLTRDVCVHLGVHDSNAALVAATAQGDTEGEDRPRRADGGGPSGRTALLSTGTWCVAMAPGAGGLAASDQSRGILLNLDVDGRPVRTSIYKAGGLYAELRASLFEFTAHPKGGTTSLRDAGPDHEAELRMESSIQTDGYPRILLPARPDADKVVVDMSPHHSLDWRQALATTAKNPDFRELWSAALGRAFAEAAWQQLTDTGVQGRRRVVVEGGFRRNRPYLQALTRLAAGMEVIPAPDEQGSARGAALLALGRSEA